MSVRELILLSPYRFPAKNSLMLAGDDVAGFLNGYTALWHPAALRGSSGPPRIASPYDYEQPTAGHVYAIPESPPLILPDDWDQRVLDAGAVAFRSSVDREFTLQNLREALRRLKEGEKDRHGKGEPAALAPGGMQEGEPGASAPGGNGQTEAPPGENLESNGQSGPPGQWWLELGPDKVRPFFGIGFGYAMVEALFEAMEHENLLAAGELWNDVQQALAALGDADPEAWRRHLKSAAERLTSAREVLYPVTIHVIDLALLAPCAGPAGVQPDGAESCKALPAAFDRGFPCNVVASGAVLERLGRERPEQLAAMRERIQEEKLEVCGGAYLEREDPLLPVESQLWNLTRGLSVSRELLGTDVRVYARQRFAAHPQLPLLLNSVGLSRTLLLTFDDSSVPAFRTTVVSWPSPEGKQVEAFTRAPYRAEDPVTFFHVAHYLHQTIMQDHAATLALLHRDTPAVPWYEDWLELSRFGPVLGQWTTLTCYFNEVMAGEQAPASAADEFRTDYLTDRTEAHVPEPVTWFARHARLRRTLDTAWTLAALHRGLARGDTLGTQASELPRRLSELENRVEAATPERSPGAPDEPAAMKELDDVLRQTGELLAERLVARAATGTPGYMVLNPCSFARRVALELDAVQGPWPVQGPIKACQVDGGQGRLVVEVPALGFAWIPRSGPPGTPAAPSRMRLADARHVRNEFFEAEIDPGTGGLRGIWDPRTRVSRLGQQLVYNPGSTVRANEVKVNSAGPALGEVVSEGVILGEQQETLARFRQRFRAWLGRPVLEMRIEILPEHPPEGYPWHMYYGARFAWRDERALLLRGLNGSSSVTNHTRPETPEYLELRLGRQSTVLFPGGLPFHQRHGTRMLDVILVPEGESATAFDLAIGLDRELPAQTAMGLVTPAPLIPVAKGPPHIGAAGWLFHLDAPNLMLTGLRPAADGSDAVTARMLECGIQYCQAELRCPRDPKRAALLDGRGEPLIEASINGDASIFDVAHDDLVQLRVEFS